MVSGSKWLCQDFLYRSSTQKQQQSKNGWILDRLDNFILAEYGAIDDIRKRAIMLTAIGDEALIAIENFEVAEKDTFYHLLVKVLEYFKEKQNEIVERHKFHI